LVVDLNLRYVGESRAYNWEVWLATPWGTYV